MASPSRRRTARPRSRSGTTPRAPPPSPASTLVALGVPTRDGVHAWVDHLSAIDQKHGGLVTGHHGGTVLVGLHDPGGIEIRLYAT